MASLTQQDLGGCNCGPLCKPCVLPTANLTDTWSWHCGADPTDSGTATLNSLGGGVWLSNCMNFTHSTALVKSAKFRIDCNILDVATSKIGTRYSLTHYTAAACGGSPGALTYYYWSYNDGTSAANGLALVTTVCSPLSLTFNGPCSSIFTITP